MASSRPSNNAQGPPRVLHFDLIEGMQLEINISGSLERRNVRIELQLKNCTRTWILHWGFVCHGNKNWFIPADNSSAAKSYKHGALQSQFMKHGQIYMLIIELRDPNIHAIEFVLKDGSYDRWLKFNHGNFQIEIPASDVPIISHSCIPKDLIERKAYSLWKSKGRPISSPQQQKQHYDDALRELQSQLSKGLTLNECQNSYLTAGVKPVNDNRDQLRSRMPYSYQRRYNVEEWLQKNSEGHAKRTGLSTASLINLIAKFMGGTDAMSRQSYHVHKYEIVVFLKFIGGDHHIFIAAKTKGATVLPWGVSKLSPSECLVPPQEIWPENSKLVSGACRSYFRDKFTGNGFFQFNREAKEVVIWLLDEISRREKEGERSLMHRFNIATELTERCRTEGELGLIGILVWFRFMACRHLT